MTDRIFCCRDDCTRRATHLPCITVPYADELANSKTPAKLLLNLQLCEHHIHELGRAWVWDDKAEGLKKGMEDAAAKAHPGAKLNFKKTTLEPEPIGSALHLKYIESRKKASRVLTQVNGGPY